MRWRAFVNSVMFGSPRGPAITVTDSEDGIVITLARMSPWLARVVTGWFAAGGHDVAWKDREVSREQ